MKKKPVKPDCYTCKYRGTIAGDAHSCCNHPVIKMDTSNTSLTLFAMMNGKTNQAMEKLAIKGEQYGVDNAWFLWPANYDPVWLLSCKGHTKKDTP